MTCFKKPAYYNSEFVNILAKALPQRFSADDAEELAQRTVESCKYAPSVAEIVTIWRTIEREHRQRRQYTTYEAASGSEKKPNPELLKRVQERYRGFMTHEPMPTTDITDEVRQFVSEIFPGLSETIIADDLTDIEYCMRERQKEERNHSPYRTTLRMGRDGHLELWMQKVRT